MTDRPEIVEDEHLEYLHDLRESGAVNMFGAGEYLRRRFKLNDKDSATVLGFWMDTF